MVSIRPVRQRRPRTSVRLSSLRRRPARSVHFIVAVVGALGRHKGLDFLTEMASQLQSDVRIVVIRYVDGKIEPGWLVDERVWVHGAFEPYELPAIVQRYGCRGALF